MAHTRRSTWDSLRALGPARRCALMLRAGCRCTWCGVELVTDPSHETQAAQIDHVVPRWQDGPATNENLVASCPPCNQRRPVGWAWPAEQLAAPVDLAAGRMLSLVWYPFAAARYEDAARRKRDARARATAARLAAVAEALAAGLGGTAFPFGAGADPKCENFHRNGSQV